MTDVYTNLMAEREQREYELARDIRQYKKHLEYMIAFGQKQLDAINDVAPEDYPKISTGFFVGSIGGVNNSFDHNAKKVIEFGLEAECELELLHLIQRTTGDTS